MSARSESSGEAIDRSRCDGRLCSCIASSWTRSSRNGWSSETDSAAKCHYKVCLIEGLVHTTHPVPFPRPVNWSTSEPLSSRDPGGIVWRPAAEVVRYRKGSAERPKKADTEKKIGPRLQCKVQQGVDVSQYYRFEKYLINCLALRKKRSLFLFQIKIWGFKWSKF